MMLLQLGTEISISCGVVVLQKSVMKAIICISNGKINNDILHQYLNIERLSTRQVMRLQTIHQKRKRLTCSKSGLELI